jgi:hypothetical protein
MRFTITGSETKRTDMRKITFTGNAEGFWLFIGVIILTGSMVLNQRFERVSAIQQMGGQSNGFHGKNIKDEYAAPQAGSYEPDVVLPLTFSLNVPEGLKKIQVLFRYRCVSDCKSLWLQIPSQDGYVSIRLLLQHELLKSYRYPSVSTGGMTLFQRHIEYQSVEDFMSHPPDTAVVYSENTLQQLFPSSLKSTYLLDQSMDNSPIPDFILTSFLKPRIFPDNWYEYRGIIDIGGAKRDKNGFILMEIVSEKGEIKLDVSKPELTLIQ